MTLKAENVDITLGTLCRLEDILGEEKLQRLIETQSVDISLNQRRQIFEHVFGYSTGEAGKLTVELMEAELSFFFSKWLMQSEQAQIASMTTALSILKSQAASGSLATPLIDPNSSPSSEPLNT